MSIEIHGDLDGTMTHLVFHIHGAFAILQQERGERMAEIMEAHLPNACTLQQAKELQAHSVLMQRFALGVGEYPR